MICPCLKNLWRSSKITFIKRTLRWMVSICVWEFWIAVFGPHYRLYQTVRFQLHRNRLSTHSSISIWGSIRVESWRCFHGVSLSETIYCLLIKWFSIVLGTAFINAVFYGVKNDGGNGEKDENGCGSKETACTSSGTAVAAPTTVRKHVLQVSTYQVCNFSCLRRLFEKNSLWIRLRKIPNF
jgi:hypothetical protein